MRLKCRCGYTWQYTGNKKYATCPDCHSKISVEKHKYEPEMCDWLKEQWDKGKINFKEFEKHIKQCEECQVALCSLSKMAGD